MPEMSEKEFAERADKALKKAEKPALLSLEGIMSLGTAIAGIVVSVVPWGDTTSKAIGLVIAASASIYLAHTRGKLKELLIQLAGDYAKK